MSGPATVVFAPWIKWRDRESRFHQPERDEVVHNYFRGMTIAIVEVFKRLHEMNAQADVWVRERRLRPIYELLDSGNNKKVIAEADKLLKKQGAFTCAKVLKALALIRMGKNEEAHQILNPVIQEIPTEDATIQALSICYRELDEPATLCSILEAACKKEPTEELLTHCFMAQVRVQDYQKQHLTALSLYKSYNKATYFGWAIASLVVKFERNAPELKNGAELLPLKLAERMCDKLIQEKTCPMDDSILNLFLITLAKLENWEKLLKEMKGQGYPKEKWGNDHFHDLYCTALTKLNQMDELFDYLKSTFIKNPEEYDVLREIISTFAESKRQAVQELLDELRENNPSRVVALADLYFCHKVLKEKDSPRIQEDLEVAIELGADKLSFYSDLADSFQHIGETTAQAMLKIMNPAYSDTKNNYATVKQIIKDVNFEMLHREAIPVTSVFERMKRADRCFGKYLASESQKPVLANDNNMRTKESEYHDQFLVIAASSLIAQYYKCPCSDEKLKFVVEMLRKKKDWISNDDHPEELKQIRKELDPSPEVTEGLVKFLGDLSLDNNQLGAEDLIFVLLTAILLLEYGLKRTPYNHSFRILLAKSYCRLGANLSAWKVMQQLDLKHVQWDSLGYLIYFETIGAGLYQESLKMLTTAENMYSGYKRESMEHVITAYKYGSFNKIAEFLAFRDQLLNSTHCGLVFCEKRLLELLLSTNASELRKTAEGIFKELDPSLLDKTTFLDNRDFTVLQCLAEDIDLDYLKKVSGETDAHFYKIRMSLLFCLAKLVNHLGNLEDAQERADIITCIDAYERHVATWDTLYASYRVVDIPTPLFHGIWPPRCQNYSDMGCFNVLKDMFCYIKGLLKSEEIDRPAFDNLKGIMVTGCLLLLKRLTCFNNTEYLCALSELSIDVSFTKLHYVLETFSFMRIVLECAIKIDKHKVNVWKQDTNKKGRIAVMSGHKKLHQESIKTLFDGSGKLVKYVDDFRDKMKRYQFKRCVRDIDKSEILLRPSFLFKPFKENYSEFFENVEESIRFQTDEIRKVAQNHLDFIKHIDP